MSLETVERIIQEVSRDYHVNGSLSPLVLRRMVELHRSSGARRSAETGCGLTTLILSNLSERHLSFADGSGDSLPKTRSHPYFKGAAVQFVVGPSQRSLPTFTFDEPLDFVLLDGPHAYPFPDLEYYFFYPHIRAGGILMVDDIHIPTIGNMYMVLHDDEMWEHLGDVETTAFFRRTMAPTHNPIGDDWHAQRFNRRYFPYPAALEPIYGEGWYRREFEGELSLLPGRGAGAPSVAPLEIQAILDQQAREREHFRADALMRQLLIERRAAERNAREQAAHIDHLRVVVRKLRAEKLAAEARAAALEDAARAEKPS